MWSAPPPVRHVPSGHMSDSRPARAPADRSGASPVTAGLARVLDDLVRVPGTNRRVGLDPVIGLVPVVGDAVGTVVAAAVFADAAHKATSKNLRLVDRAIAEGRRVDTDARGYLLRAIGAVGLILLVLLGLVGLALWGLLRLIGLV